MRVRTFIFLCLCSPVLSAAEQTTANASEPAPDMELLEFLALFDQRDAAVMDEIFDEQQASAAPRKTNGERYEQ